VLFVVFFVSFLFLFEHTCQHFRSGIAGCRLTATSASSLLRINLTYAMSPSGSRAITEAEGDKRLRRSSHEFLSGRHRFRHACRDD
jgi:hypothetical protein